MPVPSPAPPRRTWLSATDQLAAALVLGIGLAVMGVHHWYRSHTPGLIEIERAEPRPAHYWVDINRAELPEFLLLPEIGETLARRIVEDRQLNGPFRDHADLGRVRGIGPKTLERIGPYLRPLPKMDAMAGP